MTINILFSSYFRNKFWTSVLGYSFCPFSSAHITYHRIIFPNTCMQQVNCKICRIIPVFAKSTPLYTCWMFFIYNCFHQYILLLHLHIAYCFCKASAYTVRSTTCILIKSTVSLLLAISTISSKVIHIRLCTQPVFAKNAFFNCPTIYLHNKPSP